MTQRRADWFCPFYAFKLIKDNRGCPLSTGRSAVRSIVQQAKAVTVATRPNGPATVERSQPLVLTARPVVNDPLTMTE